MLYKSTQKISGHDKFISCSKATPTFFSFVSRDIRRSQVFFVRKQHILINIDWETWISLCQYKFFHFNRFVHFRLIKIKIHSSFGKSERKNESSFIGFRESHLLLVSIMRKQVVDIYRKRPFHCRAPCKTYIKQCDDTQPGYPWDLRKEKHLGDTLGPVVKLRPRAKLLRQI